MSPPNPTRLGISGMRSRPAPIPAQEAMMKGLRRPTLVQIRSERKLVIGAMTSERTLGRLRDERQPGRVLDEFPQRKQKRRADDSAVERE